MKILCVIDSLGSGGAQRQLLELGIGFMKRGYNTSFLIYHNTIFYKSLLKKEGISVTCIKECNYLTRLINIRQFIRRGNFDAVFSFLEAPNLYCELAGLPFRKWKLIVGERSADPMIVKSMKRKFYRWFHFFSDFVVTNSAANMDIIRSTNLLLPASKCKIIYNSIDFSKWPISSYYTPWNDKKFKLTVAASHRYLKNLNGLLDALSLLSTEDKNKITVDWYGDKITKPFLDNSFIEAKRKIVAFKLEKVISFHPATNEINKVIQNSDAIGLFSFYEGLPNIICEGMACAKPIICSSISDLSDLLSYDKNLLFDPYDPQSIKTAINYLVNLTNDKLNYIGSMNHKIAKEKFDSDKIISSYLKLISL